MHPNQKEIFHILYCILNKETEHHYTSTVKRVREKMKSCGESNLIQYFI